MPPEAISQGQIIAVEGTHGRDVAEGAKRLWRELRRRDIKGGISRWDASGTFYETRLAKPNLLTMSPRTLVLLYACDLVFRIRWEVRLAVEEGQCVIVAPYVETAIGFGVAAGLPRRWLTDLFSFAPKPSACFRISERKKRSLLKEKPSQGFLGFCTKALNGVSLGWEPVERRREMIAYLDERERGSRCRRLTKKAAADAAKEIRRLRRRGT